MEDSLVQKDLRMQVFWQPNLFVALLNGKGASLPDFLNQETGQEWLVLQTMATP